MTTDFLSAKAIRPILYTLAILTLLGAAYLVMPLINSWGGLLIGVCLGFGALALASMYVPELFLVILLVGMPVWGLMPESVGARFDGLWIPLTLAMGVGSFGFYAASHGRLRLAVPRPVREDVWLILFTGWLGVATSWSASFSYGMFKFLGFAANVLCVYLLVRWATAVRLFNLQRMAKLLIVASLIHVAVVIHINIQIGSWGIDSAVDGWRTRALQQMGLNKIAESTAIAFGILATLWFRFRRQDGRRSGRVWVAALLLLQTWGLLNYQQRGPMVGLGLGIVLMFMLSTRRIWQTFRQGRLGTLLVVALGVLVVLGLGFYILNPSFHVSYISADGNVSTRFTFYALAWETFRSSPLTGVGLGGMGTEAGEGYQEFHAHNLFLEIMAELGLVGLGLFLAFCGVVAIRLYRAIMRLDVRAIHTIAFPAAVFLYICSLAMFSGDLTAWKASVWVAAIISVCRRQLYSNAWNKPVEEDLPLTARN